MSSVEQKTKQLLAATISFSLLLPAVTLAAYNDVTVQATANIVLPSNGLTYKVETNTIVESFTVNNDTIVFTMPTNSVAQLVSADKSVFTVTNSTCDVSRTCSSQSDLYISCTGSATQTVTVGIGSGTCAAGSGGGSGSGGGGGGGGASPAVPAVPAIPAIPATPATPAVPAVSPAVPATPATSAAPAVPTSVSGLKVGATSGSAILSLQQFLNANGFTVASKGPGSPGNETKTLGNATKKALKAYQKSVGLPQTGKLDAATVNALSGAVEQPAASSLAGLKVGLTSGDAILALQQFLNANGFTVAVSGAGSPGKETKTLGNATKKALKAYQESVGLPQTGKLDTATVNALSGVVEQPAAPASASPLVGLKVGATSGNAILALQQFLNANGFTVAVSGAGSPGKETKFLGNATKKALKAYQKSVDLPQTGKLDKATVKALQK